MAEAIIPTAVITLAGRAADLSTEVYSLQEDAVHFSGDMASVAGELMLLSTTLWCLGEASENVRYTESFKEDLAEIVEELKMVPFMFASRAP